VKKKVLAITLATMLVLTLGLVFAAPAGAEPIEIDLLAGQDIDVGDVSVWNDCDNLYVKYETTGDWEITGTHLYVGKNSCPPPTTAPGQFPYDDDDATSVSDTEVLYTIPLAGIDGYHMQLNKQGKPTGVMIADGSPGVEPCTDVCIAAQAEVIRETATELVQNGSFEYPEINNPPYNWDAIPSGATGLEWTVDWYDPSFTWSTTAPSPALLEVREQKLATAYDGDQFVELDTAYGSPPRGSEPASVTISQSIAACPSGLYTLRYAWAPRADHADNQVEVMWNGSSLATHSADGTGGTSWTGEEHAYLAGPSSGPFTLAFRETGTAEGLGMYLDAVSVVCIQEETAWGDGTVIREGKNWATYFEYHVQQMPTGEAGEEWSDVATAYEWEARARHGGAGGWRAFVDDVFPPVNPLWTSGTVPWLNGGQMWFELIYDDDTNSATFTIYRSSDDYVLGTVSDTGLSGFSGLIGIQGKTSAEAAGSVVVDNVEVNGTPVCGDDGFTAQGTDFYRDLKYLDISHVPSGDFTLTGDLIFTWGAHPSSEGPCLSIYVQNIP
jgi:hypothetical protein